MWYSIFDLNFSLYFLVNPFSIIIILIIIDVLLESAGSVFSIQIQPY